MALRQIEQVKKRKPFALWDLAVYGALAMFIVILFIAFVFTADRSPIDGIRFVYDEETVYSYSFADGSFVADGWENRIEEERDGNELVVTFYEDEARSEYNVITIDLQRRAAKVTDTNCSRHKDCMYMKEIATVDGVIICVPHGLKILALNGEENWGDGPILG